MKIYLAGPIRGLPEGNRRAFERGAAVLRRSGHEVFSPLEHDLENGLPFGSNDAIRISLKADLDWICDAADAVVMLPGWETSKGSQAEVWTAKALGLRTMSIETFAEWHNYD